MERQKGVYGQGKGQGRGRMERKGQADYCDMDREQSSVGSLKFVVCSVNFVVCSVNYVVCSVNHVVCSLNFQ